MNLQKRLETNHMTRTHFNRFESYYLLYVDPTRNNAKSMKCPQNTLRVFIQYNEVQDKFHYRTDHECSEGRRSIPLLFL
jgi:hypothetical protein